MSATIEGSQYIDGGFNVPVGAFLVFSLVFTSHFKGLKTAVACEHTSHQIVTRDTPRG